MNRKTPFIILTILSMCFATDAAKRTLPSIYAKGWIDFNKNALTKKFADRYNYQQILTDNRLTAPQIAEDVLKLFK